MVQPVQYEGINMLCFACGRLDHRKGNCLALIRNSACSNMNTPPSNTPKNPSSSESLENDQPTVSLKDSESIPQENVMELEAFAYREWMVVKRRKKPNGNGKSAKKGSTRDRIWRQDSSSPIRDPQEIPRDTIPDSRKDMKRKAPIVTTASKEEKDGLHKGSNC
nr:hypothetical protein CFP56_44650 [Quercus suber]